MAKKTSKTVSKKSTAKITASKPKKMAASKSVVASKVPKLLSPKTPYKRTELFGTLTEQNGSWKKRCTKSIRSLTNGYEGSFN